MAQGDVVDHLAVAHDQNAVGVRRDPCVMGDKDGRLVLLTAEPK